eukprot:810807-Prymnesium_polylepis.3
MSCPHCSQLIYERIIGPSNLEPGQLLFVDDNLGHIQAAQGRCCTRHISTAGGMSQVDYVFLYRRAGVTFPLLRAAAAHVKPLFLQPYEDPPAGASNKLKQAWKMDWRPVYGVERPNHALANGIRKAHLVPIVLDAYRKHFVGSKYGGKAEFTNIGPELVEAMQVGRPSTHHLSPSDLLCADVHAIACCRKSDIGYSDDSRNFLRFGAISREQFRKFGARIKWTGPEWELCSRTLESMYCPPGATAVQHVVEMAHDLDCIRCYDEEKMANGSLAKLERDLGKGPRDALAIEAERMILATGDRVFSYSPSKRQHAGQGFLSNYVPGVFAQCNRDVGECLKACEPPLPKRLLPIEEPAPATIPYFDWINDVPLRNCLYGLASNKLVQCRVPKYKSIVTSSRNRIEWLRKENGLTDNELAAIVAYMHDLDILGREQTLEYELNKMLRNRDAEGNWKSWAEFVHYLICAARKLKDVHSTVYRVIQNGDMVRDKYGKGSRIQWGAFVSTTTDLEQAQRLATSSRSVVARIRVTSGKSFAPFAVMKDEQEIVLLPTMHFSVMRATYVKDGFTFVDLEEMPIVEGEGGEKVGIDWEWFMDLKGRIREEPPATLRDALLGLGHDEVGIDVKVLLSKVSEQKEKWEWPDHLAKLRDEVGLASSFTMDQALAIWVYTLNIPNVFERMSALTNDKVPAHGAQSATYELALQGRADARHQVGVRKP